MASSTLKRAGITHDISDKDPRSQDDASETPFRFFDLPRELRNVVYAQLTLERRSTGGWGGYDGVFTTNFCMGEMVGVNRQFKSEYEEEVLRFAQVELEVDREDGHDSCNMLKSELPTYIDKLQHVTIRVLRAWYGWEDDVVEDVDVDEARSRFQDSIGTLQKGLAKLLPRLKALRTLNLEIHGVLDLLPLGVERFDPLSFFTVDLFGRDATANIQSNGIEVNRSLTLESIMYRAYVREDEDGEGRDEAEEKADHLEADLSNVITYRAVPPEDEQSGYHGLELQTISAGVFDYKRIMARYRSTQGRARFNENDFLEDFYRWNEEEEGRSEDDDDDDDDDSD